MRELVLGAILFVLTESVLRYDATDLPLAAELAGRAALAIDNAHLYEVERIARAGAEAETERLLAELRDRDQPAEFGCTPGVTARPRA